MDRHPSKHRKTLPRKKRTTKKAPIPSFRALPPLEEDSKEEDGINKLLSFRPFRDATNKAIPNKKKLTLKRKRKDADPK